MEKGSVSARLSRGLLVLAVVVILWLLPVPAKLTPVSWHLFAIFAGVILGLILQPLPMGAIVILGLSVAAITRVLAPADILSGFANTVVWLIVSAFMFARGFIRTGLGRRIAYTLIKAFGGTSLGLAYSVLVSDLVISPATPSNTARGGGIIFPIVRSLAEALGSKPGSTADKIGSFLMLSEFHGNLITSAMFITACAPNTFMTQLAQKTFNVNITWGLWALAALVPGVVGLLLVPMLIYRLSPPEVKRSPEAPKLAQAELQKMGPMTTAEKVMLFVFLATLLLWATGQWNKLDATMVAFAGVSLMLIGGAVTWDDVLGEKGAWDALIWFGGLTSLAGALAKVGFIKWFADFIAAGLPRGSWVAALVIVVLVYTYSHYLFATITAHVTAMYVPFATIAVATGASPLLTSLILAFFSNLMPALTHYGTGPAPIYFGAGYVSQSKWWKIGFLMALVSVVIWLGIGSLWWKVIGLW